MLLNYQLCIGSEMVVNILLNINELDISFWLVIELIDEYTADYIYSWK